MEILNVKSMSTTVTEFITTKCGKTYVLVQMFTNASSEMNYSVFDLNGVEVTDNDDVDEMMGRYFELKFELENGINSDDDVDDFDPFK